MAASPTVERKQGHCALCIARCGSIAVVKDGRFVALEPDPSHPTGQALCAKGRAAPELVYHPDRLLHPLRRTRPKGDADPGWERIGWDDALDRTAAALRRIAERHGPHAVAFSRARRQRRPRCSNPWRWLPDDVVFVEEILHTAVGKVEKKVLRAMFRDQVLPECREA
jgi:predicted molibdopterin-dependent oxidoreductase YjgC